MRGPAVGGSISYQRGASVVWMGRLGAGAFLAGWRDDRKGTFRATPASPAYETPRLAEDGSVVALYINPELRAGYPFAKGWTFDVGVQAFVLFGLSQATWGDVREFNAGQCPNVDPNVCAGRGRFGSSPLFGTTVILLSPLVGLRYEF